MKILIQNKFSKQHTKIVLKEGKTGNRFVETKEGQTELHFFVAKLADINTRKFIALVREMVRTAKAHKVEHLALDTKEFELAGVKSQGTSWLYRSMSENLLIASYEFETYKSKKDKTDIKDVILLNVTTKEQKDAVADGIIVGSMVNESRDIANTSGDDMTPAVLGKTAIANAKGSKITVKVLDPKTIQKEGLHALWAVGKGADDLPRFIIMEYKGGPKSEKPIVLIGKGVTYDTGGLNIKPSGGMHDMHMDMSGGSAVISSIIACAKLGIKKNVVALIPTAENAVSEKSMRAGDIIKSHSGKTIEVLHTDAEGRLILADALSYCKKYNPRAIIDVATLTGASLVALGQHASALMTKDEKLSTLLVKLGEESGDYVWPLPLWDEYKAPLTRTRADVVNIHPNFSRHNGAIEGAAFLSFFAPTNVPWVHLDIAPRMEAAPHDKLAKGSTGEPVRLLIKFIENY